MEGRGKLEESKREYRGNVIEGCIREKGEEKSSCICAEKMCSTFLGYV